MKSQFLQKLNRLADKAFPIVVILFLLLGLVRTLYFPKEHNYYENRYSNQVQFPTVDTILDHSFQDSFEDALADQIPKAESLKKLYNTISSSLITPLIRGISGSNSSVYINYKGHQLFGDHIVYPYSFMEKYQAGLDAKAESFNAVIDRNPDVEFFAYFIEKDTDVNFETGRKLQASQYMMSSLMLADSNKFIYEISSYEEFKEYFYQTDHHWNYKGSYLAYQQLHELLGCEGDLLIPVEEKTIFHSFAGSKAGTIGSTAFTEDFTAYRFAFPTIQVTENGIPVADYGAQDTLLNANDITSLTYGGFYGSDSGEIIFNTGNEARGNILIIGESYDNAILKLLASHYHMTFSIDLRNYEHFMGQTFDIDRYIEEHQIDQVLFIGNVDFYASDAFLLE